MLVALVASVFVGYARRGRLRHYLERPLRGIWLPIAAYALESVSYTHLGRTSARSAMIASPKSCAPARWWSWLPVWWSARW